MAEYQLLDLPHYLREYDEWEIFKDTEDLEKRDCKCMVCETCFYKSDMIFIEEINDHICEPCEKKNQ